MKTTTKTWKVTVEVANGSVKTLSWKAATLSEAVDLTIAEVSVVNLLKVTQHGKRVL
jgi:hypothetical protein